MKILQDLGWIKQKKKGNLELPLNGEICNLISELDFFVSFCPRSWLKEMARFLF